MSTPKKIMCCLLSLSFVNVLMIYGVSGTEFKYGTPTCVDVIYDAEFTLTDGEESVQFTEDNLTVKNGLCANENQTVSNIRLANVKGDALVFTFTKSSNSRVTLNTLFYFSPNDFFNTTDDTGINADEIGITDLAAPDEKFECNSPRTMNFSPQRGITKTYTLSLVLSNVQMQAFDMKNGYFSDKVFVCENITNGATTETTAKATTETTAKATTETTAKVTMKTTAKATTETTAKATTETTAKITTETTVKATATTETTAKVTTETTAKATTEITAKATTETTAKATTETTAKVTTETTVKATTETTAKATTKTTAKATTTPKSNETTTQQAQNSSSATPTSPATTAAKTTVSPTLAPPNKLTYMYPKDKPCIIMEGSFQLKIKYEKKDNKTEEKYVNFPSTNSEVIVTGSCPTGSKSSLTLYFGKNQANRILTYNFVFDENNEASIERWKANIDLDPANFPHAKKTTLDVTYNDTVKLSQNTMYYQCLAPQMLGKDPLTFITRYYKVQAFNVTENKFADDGIDCVADVNPTPNPSAPPTNTYSLTQDQNTCLVFRAGIQFTIPYISKTGDTTAFIALPINYTTGGTCNVSGSEYYTQQLIITFYDAWKLTMDFTSDVKNAPANLLAAASPASYYLSNVNLDYDMNSNLFYDAAPTDK